MSCDEIREELDAYALGVLDDDEAQAVEAHLAVCPDCRRLAREASAAAHALPFALASASSLAPPVGLKERVVGLTSEDRGANGMLTLPDRRRVWWAAAAAILLVAIGSMIWSVRLSSALDRERATRERVEAFYSRQQEIVLEVVDSSKTTKLVLTPPDGTSGPYGKLFTRSDMPDVVAMVGRMPAAPESQTYHLRLTAASHTVDAGALAVDEQGFGLLTFRADRTGPTYDAVEIWLQADGDSEGDGIVVLRWEPSTDG